MEIILFSKNAGPIYPYQFHFGTSLLLWFIWKTDKSLR